jgi:hypothetical protein
MSTTTAIGDRDDRPAEKRVSELHVSDEQLENTILNR